MGKSIFFILLSLVSGVFLKERNMTLTDNQYLFAWVVTAVIFVVGIWGILETFYYRMKNSTNIGSDEEKKCPMCAELIKREARKCKHCGHEFGDKELIHDK